MKTAASSASSVFVTAGYITTSIGAIATKAAVSEQTVYYPFS